jgi:hypothetical protein
MKVLLLGDSNCRGMDLLALKSHPDVQLYLISVGGQTQDIMHKYNSNLQSIYRFNPTCILLHSGHNDLAFHSRKNPSPKDSSQATSTTLNAALALQANHSTATIVISAPFPRTFTPHSSLPMEDLLHYNKTAKRHGTRLRSEATKSNIHTLINNEMWKSKDNLKEKAGNFLTNGLHLTPAAKEATICGWINKLKNINAS